MGSLQDNYFVAFLLFVAVFAASAVHSDRYDCKEVQCPPEIKCPADSILRVTYKTNSYDDNSRNSIDDTKRQPEHNRRYVVEKSNDKNQPRELRKRSLQYKRRESIKIVPGDYISLVPESVHYHHQLQSHLQNQHKWKRSVLDSVLIDNYDDTSPPVSDIEKCCPQMACECNGNCPLPKCFKANQVPYQRTAGSDTPGKCCPQLQCIDEPNCANVNGTIYFWVTKCKKCNCVSGQRMCHKECDDESGCFSENLKKFFSNGISWQDDPCTQCQCLNGEAKCQSSFCKPLNCQTQIKIEGECCSMCAPESSSTTTTISTTDSIVSSTMAANVDTIQATTSKLSTSSTTTTSPSDGSTTILQSPSTAAAPISSTSSSPAPPVTTPTPTSKVISTPATTSTTPATVSSTIEVESTTLSSTFFQAATTPKGVLSTVAVKSESPPMTGTTNLTTPTSPADPSTTPVSTIHTSAEHALYFNTDTESIILYTVIVVLLVICCMFAGLYIHEVTKRQTYSSIPNSDSNLSQMPRPKTEESA